MKSPHCKNVGKFYGKITGNQLPCQSISRYYLQAPVNIFRNQAQNSSKGHYFFFFFFFLSYSPTILQRYFRVLSVNITLPYLWQPDARYFTVKSTDYFYSA